MFPQFNPVMEATGLEEPFWYIIISTGGTFIILATTVLVFGELIKL